MSCIVEVFRVGSPLRGAGASSGRRRTPRAAPGGAADAAGRDRPWIGALAQRGDGR